MTVTLSPEVEQELQNQADESGITADDMAASLIWNGLIDRTKRRQAMDAIRNGKYVRPRKPNEPLDSERFAQEKAAEIEKEERRWQQ